MVSNWLWSTCVYSWWFFNDNFCSCFNIIFLVVYFFFVLFICFFLCCLMVFWLFICFCVVYYFFYFFFCCCLFFLVVYLFFGCFFVFWLLWFFFLVVVVFLCIIVERWRTISSVGWVAGGESPRLLSHKYIYYCCWSKYKMCCWLYPHTQCTPCYPLLNNQHMPYLVAIATVPTVSYSLLWTL